MNIKKLIIISLAISAFLISVWVGYSYFQEHKNPIVDTSSIKPLNINGVNYKTTGAIPSQDVSGQKTLSEVVRLASMGTIATSGYQISVEGQGKVFIELEVPFDQNKQDAISWLENNGFSDIPQHSITFQENQ